MKRIFLIALLFIIFSNLKSQNIIQRYGCWYMPSFAEKIHGIALDGLMTNEHLSQRLTINGAHIQVNPIFGFMLPVAALASIYSLSNLGPSSRPSTSNRCKVNGLNLTFYDEGITNLNGIDINLIISSIGVVRGVSISGLMNRQYSVDGLTMALMSNKNYVCKGIQISILNYCKKFTGFQIGLWNINQRRQLPFINWCFNP
jgi:hypothetical protein